MNVSNQPEIVHELTSVIREWGAIWKQLYVSHHPNFNRLENQINKLLLFKKEMSTGKLLVHQLKEKQKLASIAIDVGNKWLKLDMVVRDEQGNKLNPLRTPILQLYEYHEATAARTKDEIATGEYELSIDQSINNWYRYSVHLSIRNRDQISALHNIDLVKQILFTEVITPGDVKNHFSTMLLNGELSRGVDLLNFLQWTSRPERLRESLAVLKNLNGQEVLMYLHDVLDSLFNIYKNNHNNSSFDTEVFDCLLYIIELISEENNPQFKPVLDVYIEKHFNAKLAYIKLMAVLKIYLIDWDRSLNVYKSFKYIMKFIAKSKLLSSELLTDNDHQIFEKSLNEILKLFSNVLQNNSEAVLELQGPCLKYIPQSIPDLITVFNSTQLSSFLVQLLDNLPPTKLVKLKLIAMRNIVQSQLFLSADCRAILIPCILVKIKETYQFLDVLDWCQGAVAKLCGDILDLLYVADAESTFNDITEIMISGLHLFNHIVLSMDRDNPMMGYVASLMTSILCQMTDKHFDAYVKHFTLKTDLLDFLKDTLMTFTDLVTRPLFPDNWCDMIMLQNSVLFKSLKHFARTIREYFSEDFDHEVWTNFFHCVSAFMLQPSLQLEQFSPAKRSRIISTFKDMRLECEILIQEMWSYLRQYKVLFMPDMVSFILEISLIPENEIRQTAIPIFFDMMQCEFYSCAGRNDENNRISGKTNFKFNVFQDKMISNIDRLVVAGKGDKQYIELFKNILLMHCESHSTMRDQGIQFVEKFTKLLERLLEYQIEINDENINNKINSTVYVLNYYIDIQQHELTISYVNKLCALYLECGNYTEIAYTLKVYSELLSWSNDPLPPLLKSPTRYPTCETHGQLKEALFKDMIDYFNRGKMWEYAVTVCDELAVHYKSRTFEYTKLSTLLQRTSNFYENVLKELRTEPKYFRIAYYGRGFPSYLQNKIFIYRGKEYESLNDLSKSVMHQFPNAIMMQNVLIPGPEINDSFGQYIQISNVKPIMDHRYNHLLSTSISEKILQHYRVNYVKQFNYSKKSKRVSSNINDDNEFAKLWIERTVMKTEYSLPSMVRWTPVTDSHTYEISPLKIAIETMEEKNRSLKELLISHQNYPELPLDPLSMTLYGILDAAVMGGVSKYEQAFFTPEYLENHKEDEKLIDTLKNLVASQLPLLDIGVKLHGNRVSLSLYNMQSHLENRFKKMKKHIEENYGEKTCNTTFENCFDIAFDKQEHDVCDVRSALVLSRVTRPLFAASNSVYGYPATSFNNADLTYGYNKYHTIGRNVQRNIRAKKKFIRTTSQSLERIDKESITSTSDNIHSKDIINITNKSVNNEEQ